MGYLQTLLRSNLLSLLPVLLIVEVLFISGSAIALAEAPSAPPPTPTPPSPTPAVPPPGAGGEPSWPPTGPSGAKSAETVLHVVGVTQLGSCNELKSRFQALLDSSEAFFRNLVCDLPRTRVSQLMPGLSDANPDLSVFYLSAKVLSADAANQTVLRMGSLQGEAFVASVRVPCDSLLVFSTTTEDQDTETMYTFSCNGLVAHQEGSLMLQLTALCCDLTPPSRPASFPPDDAAPPPDETDVVVEEEPPVPPQPPPTPQAQASPPPRRAARPPPAAPVDRSQLKLYVMVPPQAVQCGKLKGALDTLAGLYGFTVGNYTCRASDDPNYPVPPYGSTAQLMLPSSYSASPPPLLPPGAGDGTAVPFGSGSPSGSAPLGLAAVFSASAYVVVTALWPTHLYNNAFRNLRSALGSSVDIFARMGSVPCGREIRAVLLDTKGRVSRKDAFSCWAPVPEPYAAHLKQLNLTCIFRQGLCCMPPPPPPGPPPLPPRVPDSPPRWGQRPGGQPRQPNASTPAGGQPSLPAPVGVDPPPPLQQQQPVPAPPEGPAVNISGPSSQEQSSEATLSGEAVGAIAALLSALLLSALVTVYVIYRRRRHAASPPLDKPSGSGGTMRLAQRRILPALPNAVRSCIGGAGHVPAGRTRGGDRGGEDDDEDDDAVAPGLPPCGVGAGGMPYPVPYTAADWYGMPYKKAQGLLHHHHAGVGLGAGSLAMSVKAQAGSLAPGGDAASVVMIGNQLVSIPSGASTESSASGSGSGSGHVSAAGSMVVVGPSGARSLQQHRGSELMAAAAATAAAFSFGSQAAVLGGGGAAASAVAQGPNRVADDPALRLPPGPSLSPSDGESVAFVRAVPPQATAVAAAPGLPPGCNSATADGVVPPAFAAAESKQAAAAALAAAAPAPGPAALPRGVPRGGDSTFGVMDVFRDAAFNMCLSAATSAAPSAVGVVQEAAMDLGRFSWATARLGGGLGGGGSGGSAGPAATAALHGSGSGEAGSSGHVHGTPGRGEGQSAARPGVGEDAGGQGLARVSFPLGAGAAPPQSHAKAPHRNHHHGHHHQHRHHHRHRPEQSPRDGGRGLPGPAHAVGVGAGVGGGAVGVPLEPPREVTLLELFNQSPLVGAMLSSSPSASFTAGQGGGAALLQLLPSGPQARLSARGGAGPFSRPQDPISGALERLSAQLAMNIARLSSEDADEPGGPGAAYTQTPQGHHLHGSSQRGHVGADGAHEAAAAAPAEGAIVWAAGGPKAQGRREQGAASAGGGGGCSPTPALASEAAATAVKAGWLGPLLSGPQPHVRRRRVPGADGGGGASTDGSGLSSGGACSMDGGASRRSTSGGSGTRHIGSPGSRRVGLHGATAAAAAAGLEDAPAVASSSRSASVGSGSGSASGSASDGAPPTRPSRGTSSSTRSGLLLLPPPSSSDWGGSAALSPPASLRATATTTVHGQSASAGRHESGSPLLDPGPRPGSRPERGQGRAGGRPAAHPQAATSAAEVVPPVPQADGGDEGKGIKVAGPERPQQQEQRKAAAPGGRGAGSGNGGGGGSSALDISPKELRIQTDGLLGAGSFGSVYRGSYRGQPVAVKVLHHMHFAAAAGGAAGGPLLQQKDVDSFRQEIAILRSLAHPNIVRVLGGCAHAGHPFLVMELLPRCLHNVIHGVNGPLPLGQALRIGTDVARGLAHLHPAIVHRDLKPANILLDAQGTAKISDFGLARYHLKPYISTQQPDAGSVAYMAPEGFDPAIGRLSAKCDVYSFGVLLWELLTQEHPWSGESNVAIIYRVAVHRMRLPLPADPRVCPPRLAALLDACMSFRPCDRPDMRYALSELEAMLRLVGEGGVEALLGGGEGSDGVPPIAAAAALAAPSSGSDGLSPPEP